MAKFCWLVLNSMYSIRHKNAFIELFKKRVGFKEDIEEFKGIEEMEKIAKEESVERGELIMSIAEKLREEGMEKGIKKGIEKGKLEERKEFTIKLLSKKFGVKLTEELKEKILKTNEKTINYIGDNLLEITLDELKEILK